MQETQSTEFKREWRDEWLKWIRGFANANGGTLLESFSLPTWIE